MEHKRVEIGVSDGAVTVDRPSVPVNTREDHRVEWFCDAGQFTVRFEQKNEADSPPYSPFKSEQFTGGPGKSAKSGPIVRRGSRGYSYGVSVTLPDGTSPTRLDPDVVVNDNGPPLPREKEEGRKKKGAARRRPAKKGAARRKPAKKRAARRKPAKKGAARRKPAKKGAARRRPAKRGAARRKSTTRRKRK